MSELRRMIHGLVDSTRTRLRRDLLLLDVDEHGAIIPARMPIPRLDLDVLRDNAREFQEGWGFLRDPRNAFDVDGRT
jgi:hypothetical protein